MRVEPISVFGKSEPDFPNSGSQQFPNTRQRFGLTREMIGHEIQPNARNENPRVLLEDGERFRGSVKRLWLSRALQPRDSCGEHHLWTMLP
jgi:hypothetical protein